MYCSNDNKLIGDLMRKIQLQIELKPMLASESPHKLSTSKKQKVSLR